MDLKLALCVIAGLFLFGERTFGLDCVTRSRCVCEFDDGSGIIDLSSIGNQDGTPLFFDIPSGIYDYSYNPCYPFVEGTCTNAAACQNDYQFFSYYDIGDADQAVFSFDGSTTSVTYTSADGIRTTKVTLQCDPQVTIPGFDVTGEITTNNYEFILTTQAACKISDPFGSGAGISAGSILCILFLSGLALYLVAGVVYQKAKHQARGTSLIPNKEFWTAVPGLIKSGFVFVKNKVLRRDGYNNV